MVAGTLPWLCQFLLGAKQPKLGPSEEFVKERDRNCP